MGQIKNSAGQVFDDFCEWKKWAESPSEKWSGKQNILPELVKFLSFYPRIITQNTEGSDLTEYLSDELQARVDGNDRGIFADDSWYYKEAKVYPWRNDLYNFVQMNLRKNIDGTYTLVKIADIKGDTLEIPDLVSVVEQDALSERSLSCVVFPDNFDSSAPIKIDFKDVLKWQSIEVQTLAPLNIICPREKMEELYNGRFPNMKYKTFRALQELYPEAFTVDNGKVIFDAHNGVGLTNGDYLYKLSSTDLYVSISGGNKFSLEESWEPNFDLKACKVVAVELSSDDGDFKEETIALPSTVDTVIVDRQIDELVLNGNPHNIFLYKKPVRLRINAPLQKIKARNVVEDYKNSYGDEHRSYIFNVPELCCEESIIPGYIRATLAIRDRVEAYDVITEINTKYIVSMHPEEITLRDHPVVGTRIHMASNGIEQHQTLVVYEPMEMIAEKIAKVATQDIIEPSKIGTYE